MSKEYEAIMNMKGAEDFKRLIEKWEKLSQNIRSLPDDLPFVLPDIILSAASGSGVTYLLQRLAEYLETKNNLISFYGDESFFEFSLEYTPENAPFTEIDRFNERVTLAAGFRNEFRGIIRIDVNEWLGHEDEKYFIRFLENLAGNSDKWVIILTYSDKNERESRAMDVLIRAHMRVEKIKLDHQTPEKYVEYLEEILEKYDLSIDESGRQLLIDAVGTLCRSSYFDGFKTIRLFAQGLIYELLADDGFCLGKPFTAEDLSAFSSDGEYVKNFMLYHGKAGGIRK